MNGKAERNRFLGVSVRAILGYLGNWGLLQSRASGNWLNSWGLGVWTEGPHVTLGAWEKVMEIETK